MTSKSFLLIGLDMEFETEEFEHVDDVTCLTMPLTTNQVENLFNKINIDDLSLYVVAFKDINSTPWLTFEFNKSCAFADCQFSIKIKSNKRGLKVKVNGDLEVELRPGVLRLLNEKTIYRLQGISYLGGPLRGFISNIKNQTSEKFRDWHLITSHSTLKEH